MTTQDTAAHNAALERHSRKCAVCNHPERAAIEQEFLHWGKVWHMAKDYEIPDYRSIYDHARAFGLFEKRRRNVRAVLEHILESACRTTPTADSIIRAVRAYTRLDDFGRWVDPPARVVFSVERNVPPAAVAEVAQDVAAQVASTPGDTLVPAPEEDWDVAPLQVGPGPERVEPMEEPALPKSPGQWVIQGG